MLLQRERLAAPCARAMSLPARGRADRTLSALAGVLFLASWAVAYVALVPPDPQSHRIHIARAVEVRP